MKVFISQPMRGLAEREIKLNRLKAIENIKRLYGNDVEIIDNYFGGNEKPLFKLGKSIELLSKADIIYARAGTRRAVVRLNIYARQIMILRLFLKKVIKYEGKCTRWSFS